MALSWVSDWSWGLPLLVLTVVAHVSAIVWTAKMLGLIGAAHSRKASHFVLFVALAALACAVYLGLEAAAWAGLYLWLGALRDWRDAMLYSLGAITSYGHAEVLNPAPVLWRDPESANSRICRTARISAPELEGERDGFRTRDISRRTA